MISIKIIEVISNLSLEQKRRLHDFLHSPYHNSGYNSQRVIALYELVQVAIADNQMKNLEKHILQEHFYPDRPFVPKHKNLIDALASDLFAKLKQFLFFERVQEPSFTTQQTLALARFYRLHSFEERFWQVVRQFRKQHTKLGHRDATFYLDAFQVEAEVAAFQSTFNTYTDDANIGTAMGFLDQFYATQKLENASILTFQRQLGGSAVGQEKQTTNLLSEVYQEYTSFHTPLANHYKTILDWLYHPPTATDLENFMVVVKADQPQIEPSKFRNLMAFHRYFLSVQYRKEVSGTALLEKILKVYKEHLAEGYFLVDQNKILPQSLQSIIVVATKLGEIDWAKGVLKDFPPERITGTRFPNEAHALCEAFILFTNEEYTAAQDTLVYRSFENVNYSILADVLLIKIYFVMQDDLLENRIQALEKKVRRTKLSERDKSGYLNFLRFLLRVLKYQHDRQSKKWHKLEQDLQETRPMLEREWLNSIVLQPV